MNRRNIRARTQASETAGQSSLRAAFFVHRARQLRQSWLNAEISRLPDVRDGFDWSRPESLGISRKAWRRARDLQVEPLHVFCHPVLLRQQPQLLVYYRRIAHITRNELALVVGGKPAALELGHGQPIDGQWLGKIVFALNGVISSMLTAFAGTTADEVRAAIRMAAGVGVENAEDVAALDLIRTILVEQLKDQLNQIVWRDCTSSDYTSDIHGALLSKVDELRVLRLERGYHLSFFGRMDVSLSDPKGVPVLAIKVDMRKPRSSVSERLGAAMKSFENDRNLNPRVKTVYVVRAMTPELQRRISHTKPFDYTFSLSELLVSDKTQKTFANLVVRAILKK